MTNANTANSAQPATPNPVVAPAEPPHTEPPRAAAPAQTMKSTTDDLASFAEQRLSLAEASAKRCKSSTEEIARIEAQLKKIRTLAKAQEREREDKRRDASSAVGALAARTLLQALQYDDGLRSRIDGQLRPWTHKRRGI